MPDLQQRLDKLANMLVPVAGLLLSIACSNGRIARKPEIHEVGCDCQVCRAFFATHAVMNGLEAIIKELGNG